MSTSLPPRVVVVSRPGELEELIARHGTMQQARFFLASRGQDAALASERQTLLDAALHAVQAAVPLSWRRARVLRHELDRFLFEPEDLVVAVGQDGLVANVAKYLSGQPVAGVNPSRALNEGVLVRHAPTVIADLFATFAAGNLRCEDRTMVEASTPDGQRLVALNEIFVGHRTHQSARYRITAGTRSERHSSSGVIITTGTGASGWARSITQQHQEAAALPGPLDPDLAFYVREAWPSVATQATLTSGRLGADESLQITSEMNTGGTVFGDGVEDDHLDLAWGQTIAIKRAATMMRLVA